MIHAPTNTTPTQQATADGCDTLDSPAYDQTYHSMFGAMMEAQHVFLESTGVAERLQRGEPSRVLECDAVYLDAFSPNANPERWAESFLIHSTRY